MADEIRLRASLSFAKSGAFGARDSGDISVTMSGNDGLLTQQTVGTSEEALGLGEVSPANGYLYICNLDATNYVTVKPASGGSATVNPIVKAGQASLITFGSGVTAPFVQANTAPVRIEYLLVEG